MKETFSERLLKTSQKNIYIIFVCAITISAISFAMFYLNIGNLNLSSPEIIIATISLASLVVAIVIKIIDQADRYSDEQEKNFKRSKRGVDGEDIAKEYIPKLIGAGYEVFFNKNLPVGGDADCIILGDKGLILIEVKNFSKQVILPCFKNENFNDPRDEASRHAKYLKKYITENGYSKELKINKAVLYIDKDVIYSGSQNGVFNIIGIDKFESYFNGLEIDASMTDQDRIIISSFIGKLM